MKYIVTWEDELVCVDYSGEIENQDIQEVHLKLNGDERFYDCHYFILNISKCDLKKVSVPDLFLVVATDIGASKTNTNMKVAMVATHPNNIEKATEYIEQFRIHKSPWKFKILPSIKKAHEWFHT